jgi:hypothetical protein
MRLRDTIRSLLNASQPKLDRIKVFLKLAQSTHNSGAKFYLSRLLRYPRLDIPSKSPNPSDSITLELKKQTNIIHFLNPAQRPREIANTTPQLITRG